MKQCRYANNDKRLEIETAHTLFYKIISRHKNPIVLFYL